MGLTGERGLTSLSLVTRASEFEYMPSLCLALPQFLNLGVLFCFCVSFTDITQGPFISSSFKKPFVRLLNMKVLCTNAISQIPLKLGRSCCKKCFKMLNLSFYPTLLNSMPRFEFDLFVLKRKCGASKCPYPQIKCLFCGHTGT